MATSQVSAASPLMDFDELILPGVSRDLEEDETTIVAEERVFIPQDALARGVAWSRLWQAFLALREVQKSALRLLDVAISVERGMDDLQEPLATSTDFVDEPGRTWRGVFSPAYRRDVVASQSLELRIRELPRWKPSITISRRVLDNQRDA